MKPLLNMVGGTKSVDNTTSVKLIAANKSRKFAGVSNPNAVGMWINFGSAAVIGTGEYVPPGGGYQIDDDNLWQGDVNGIMASGGAVTIGTVEGY
jgi:hypothetical protein